MRVRRLIVFLHDAAAAALASAVWVDMRWTRFAREAERSG